MPLLIAHYHRRCFCEPHGLCSAGQGLPWRGRERVLSTVRKVENDEPSVKHARQTLIQALKNEGIEFIQNGVRLIPKAPD